MKDIIKFVGNELSAQTLQVIVTAEVQADNAVKRRDAIREALLKGMLANGITKIETPELMINFIQGTDRETFDKKRFREENPEIYDDYIEFKPTKDSIRVKLK